MSRSSKRTAVDSGNAAIKELSNVILGKIEQDLSFLIGNIEFLQDIPHEVRKGITQALEIMLSPEFFREKIKVALSEGNRKYPPGLIEEVADKISKAICERFIDGPFLPVSKSRRPSKEELTIAYTEQGKSVKKLARLYGKSRPTLYAWLEEAGLHVPRKKKKRS